MEAATNIETIMTRLAAGDVAAYAPFYAVATPAVRGILRGELGRRGVRVDPDRFDDLVGDCLLELVRMSPGWRADGGALPWNWARPKLVSLAFAGIGMFTDDLVGSEVVHEAPVVAHHDDDVMLAFELITEINRAGRALGRALREIASERDQRVWLEVMNERGGGNASPSVTVAVLHGLSPANVRKICQRVRDGLVRLASTDPSYEEILGLPGLAA